MYTNFFDTWVRALFLSTIVGVFLLLPASVFAADVELLQPAANPGFESGSSGWAQDVFQ